MAIAGVQVQGLIGKGNNASAGVDRAIQIWGLWHFADPNSGLGTAVSVSMCGQDCGDFTVATDGSVTVPLLGFTLSSVAGVVSMASLIAADGNYDIESNCPVSILNGGPRLFLNVPVVIGRVFVSQGQRLRSLAPVEVGSGKEVGLGLNRRTHMFSVLVKDATVAQFGTQFTPTPSGDMIKCTFVETGGSLAAATGYDGVWWETFDDNYTFDGMFCWQIDRPVPFVLNAVSQFLASEDR